jgi:hypothetical protein
LIPDLTGLSDDNIQALDADTNYSLTVASNVNDFYGHQIDSSNPADLTASILTRPDDGWYLGATDTNDTLFSDGQVAKFAGRPDTTNWSWDYHKIASGVPANFRLDFSIRNLKWDLVGIVLSDSSNSSAYDGAVLNTTMSSWNAWGSYKGVNDTYCGLCQYVDYYDSNGNGIANGNWIKVRVEVFGTSYRLSISEDGTNYTVLHQVPADGQQGIKVAGGEELYLRFVEPVLLDNVQLTTLGTNDPNTTPNGVGDLLDEDFDTGVSVLGDVAFDLTSKLTSNVTDPAIDLN